MKECYKIYLGFSDNISATLKNLVSKLSGICSDMGWKIKVTKSLCQKLDNDIIPYWMYMYSLNFDKENRILSIGNKASPGAINIDIVGMRSFESINIENNLQCIARYMGFDGNSMDMMSTQITSNNDILNLYIERYNRNRGIDKLTLGRLNDFILSIENSLNKSDFFKSENQLSLSSIVKDKKDFDIIAFNPPFNYYRNTHICIVTDGIFKEIFGSSSGDFLKASNKIKPHISHSDDDIVATHKHNGLDGMPTMIHINGKVIHDNEFLQMSDIGYNQLQRLIENVDFSSRLWMTTKYDSIDDKERNITLLEDITYNIYGSLANLYIISVERNLDPYYRPTIKKYELFLTEENELKLIEK